MAPKKKAIFSKIKGTDIKKWAQKHICHKVDICPIITKEGALITIACRNCKEMCILDWLTPKGRKHETH